MTKTYFYFHCLYCFNSLGMLTMAMTADFFVQVIEAWAYMHI